MGLGLGEDPFLLITVSNCLKRIGRKPIKYYNYFPMRHQLLLSEREVKYVEYIIVTRYRENLGMSNKEVIQVISDIQQC